MIAGRSYNPGLPSIDDENGSSCQRADRHQSGWSNMLRPSHRSIVSSINIKTASPNRLISLTSHLEIYSHDRQKPMGITPLKAELLILPPLRDLLDRSPSSEICIARRAPISRRGKSLLWRSRTAKCRSDRMAALPEENAPSPLCIAAAIPRCRPTWPPGPAVDCAAECRA